jgi:hypothetical protein
MFVDIDFPSIPGYDPESLLTGAEAQQGLDYGNSRRDWPNEILYRLAVGGYITLAEIVQRAPRALLDERRRFEAWQAGEKDYTAEYERNSYRRVRKYLGPGSAKRDWGLDL